MALNSISCADVPLRTIHTHTHPKLFWCNASVRPNCQIWSLYPTSRRFKTSRNI